MKNRIVVMTAVAGIYLMTCAAGFAQNATQNHSADSESSNVTTLVAHNVSPAPAAEPTHKASAKTLPVAPVVKSDATVVPSLRDAQENPYLLLTYKDETKTLANPYKESPTKIFGPGWNTNIDALRNNPYAPAPAPAPAYVDLKTLSHAVAKLL
jgi:hypothetical protein